MTPAVAAVAAPVCVCVCACVCVRVCVCVCVCVCVWRAFIFHPHITLTDSLPCTFPSLPQPPPWVCPLQYGVFLTASEMSKARFRELCKPLLCLSTRFYVRHTSCDPARRTTAPSFIERDTDRETGRETDRQTRARPLFPTPPLLSVPAER